MTQDGKVESQSYDTCNYRSRLEDFAMKRLDENKNLTLKENMKKLQ
jgi:hypothetical protein